MRKQRVKAIRKSLRNWGGGPTRGQMRRAKRAYVAKRAGRGAGSTDFRRAVLSGRDLDMALIKARTPADAEV